MIPMASPELTREIAAEEGFQVAEKDFARAMEGQRKRARLAAKADGMMVGDSTHKGTNGYGTNNLYWL